MNKEKIKRLGRPAKPFPSQNTIVKPIIQFLQLFMTATLAKRVVSMVLIAAAVPNARITEATGMSDRSIWALKKSIREGDWDSIFEVGHRSGRPGKAKGFESAIIEEVEKNNYHTRKEVADMINEKFGIAMSVSAVGKLLKKTASGG